MTPSLTDFAVESSGVAILTMRDERRKNALSFEMVAEIEQRVAVLQHDDRVKVLVLSGTDEYFSTGDRAVLDRLATRQVKPRDLLLPRALLDVPVPIVAAMAGHAVGGGLALGICADITIAARESRYGATFMQYGFTPGMGLTLLLEHVIGPALAHELLLHRTDVPRLALRRPERFRLRPASSGGSREGARHRAGSGGEAASAARDAEGRTLAAQARALRGGADPGKHDARSDVRHAGRGASHRRAGVRRPCRCSRSTRAR